jgi:hypothetical protein
MKMAKTLSEARAAADLEVEKSRIAVLEAGGGNNAGILVAEERAGDHTYVASDFDAGPLYIAAESAAGIMTLTFPDPDDFTVTATQMKHIATIVALQGSSDGSKDVSITLSAGNLRSQPGTDGWNAATGTIKMGRTSLLQDEAALTLIVDGTRAGNRFMVAIGMVRT